MAKPLLIQKPIVNGTNPMTNGNLPVTIQVKRDTDDPATAPSMPRLPPAELKGPTQYKARVITLDPLHVVMTTPLTKNDWPSMTEKHGTIARAIRAQELTDVIGAIHDDTARQTIELVRQDLLNPDKK